MRDEFRAIVSGWTLTSDVEDLGEYIEASARYVTAKGPLEPDEEATVKMMIECQVARGVARGDFDFGEPEAFDPKDNRYKWPEDRK